MFVKLYSDKLLLLDHISTILLYYSSLLGDADFPSFAINKIVGDLASHSPLTARPRILIFLSASHPDILSISHARQLGAKLSASLLNFTDFKDTALNVTELMSQNKPMELVIAYVKHEQMQETLLCQRLRACDPGNISLERHFRKARMALGELGSCAADLVLREVLETPSEDQDHSTFDQRPSIRAKDLVKHWHFRLPNLDMTSRDMNVSHKFIQLIHVLESFKCFGSDFRGIIFGTVVQGLGRVILTTDIWQYSEELSPSFWLH